MCIYCNNLKKKTYKRDTYPREISSRDFHEAVIILFISRKLIVELGFLRWARLLLSFGAKLSSKAARTLPRESSINCVDVYVLTTALYPSRPGVHCVRRMIVSLELSPDLYASEIFARL